jgi:hypothetical protein
MRVQDANSLTYGQALLEVLNFLSRAADDLAAKLSTSTTLQLVLSRE